MSKGHQHTVKEIAEGVIGYLSASGGLIAFGVDVARAFILGFVGVLGSFLAKSLYYRFIKKD
jgi:hypothetical protein